MRTWWHSGQTATKVCLATALAKGISWWYSTLVSSQEHSAQRLCCRSRISCFSRSLGFRLWGFKRESRALSEAAGNPSPTQGNPSLLNHSLISGPFGGSFLIMQFPTFKLRSSWGLETVIFGQIPWFKKSSRRPSKSS